METLIFLGLIVAILFTMLRIVLPDRVPPPQIIYVQNAPAEPSATGCFPLIILACVVLLAFILR